MNRKLTALALALALTLSLAACGGQNGTGESAAPQQTQTETNNNTAPETAPDQTAAPAENDPAQARTSDAERVVTENGSFDKSQIKTPILVTSVGQSADVSMLDALLKKTGADYTFDATIKAEDVGDYGTIVIASGASTKGLGAAGISVEDELKRAEDILKAASDKGIVVIMTHLGGDARRGTLSDQFNNIVMDSAAYIMVVEDGNQDGLFTSYCAEHNIPITLLRSISDAVTPLQELFG